MVSHFPLVIVANITYHIQRITVVKYEKVLYSQGRRSQSSPCIQFHNLALGQKDEKI